MLSHHPGFVLAAVVGLVLSFGLMITMKDAADAPGSSRVAAGTPQTFAITHPSDGSVAATGKITVYGHAGAGAIVRLGARKAVADDTGKWSMVVRLKKGKNTFGFTTRDADGEQLLRSLTVLY